jgi:hypothetical protein
VKTDRFLVKTEASYGSKTIYRSVFDGLENRSISSFVNHGYEWVVHAILYHCSKIEIEQKLQMQ